MSYQHFALLMISPSHYLIRNGIMIAPDYHYESLPTESERLSKRSRVAHGDRALQAPVAKFGTIPEYEGDSDDEEPMAAIARKTSKRFREQGHRKAAISSIFKRNYKGGQ